MDKLLLAITIIYGISVAIFALYYTRRTESFKENEFYNVFHSTIQAFIDKKGRVKDAIVMRGIPGSGLNEAAISAIRKTRFKPAKQRDNWILNYSHFFPLPKKKMNTKSS